MQHSFLLSLKFVATTVTLLAALANAQERRAVIGTATYLERIALPPNAVFEATLLDVSRAGGEATVIGRARIENPGQPPFAFSISYDPAEVDDKHSYAVRATVTVGGELMFTTDQSYRVPVQGNGATITMVMRRVARAANASAKLGALPASFAGDLPCADCPGIRYELNLFSDQSYFSRMTYLSRDVKPYDEIGRWVLTGDNLKLMHGGRPSDQFAIKSPDYLRKLDMQGKEIQSKLNYDLHRTAQFERIEPRLKMRGMFQYMADAASFAECETGQRWPVAMEGDYKALESAYTQSRHEPGAAVLVTLDGQASIRPGAEGNRQVPTLVVEKYVGISPEESCGAPLTISNLLETYWKLTRLGGKPVTVAPNQREPHMVLRQDQSRVGGFAGCNSFTGTYKLDGNQLSFNGVAATMMACLQGMEQEAEFLKVLDGVRSYRITGEHLELLDANGAALAGFEAVALR